MNIEKIGSMIDHTLLKADATLDDIIQLCKEATEYSFCSVCVNSFWIDSCVRELEGSSIKVCTVVGFPLGAVTSSTKEYETKRAIDKGAKEIDMVLNIGALKSGLFKEVTNDIRGVVQACGNNALSKVILEMCLLTPVEKEMAIKLCMDEGANFVKTSTGFSTGNATVEDVTLMRKMVGDKLGVKASGGIRSYDDAVKMIEAGANRIGTSAGKIIVQGGVSTTSY